MRKESWIAKYWRPTAAWTYIAINIFDFIIAPLINMYLFGHSERYTQWMPMTLMGAGTFHIAFGAILGVTAWSRGQEKISGVNFPREDSSYYNRDREDYRNRRSIRDLKRVPVPKNNEEL